MSEHRILIAGVGNIFFGDDAFGVEVARRLAKRPQPVEVRVVDFGIRGYDLAYSLLDGYFAVILVDTVSRGQSPGTLYVIEPECEQVAGASLDAHAMDPVKVLQFAKTLGEPLPQILLVGCEPSRFETDDIHSGLSEPVKAAAGEAVELVESLAARLLAGEQLATGKAN